MKKNLLLIPTIATLFILSGCTKDKPSSIAASSATHAGQDMQGETHEKDSAQDMAVPPVQVMQAALEGNSEIIDQALAAGFGIDKRDDQQRTALMYAAFNGHSAIVRTLLQAGANVNAKDLIGTTALMFAASGPDTDTVQILIDAGAKINAVDDNEHFSALMWAAAEGQLENARLLLRHGADPALKDVDGDTAGSFAAQRGHATLVELLKNADLN